MATAKKKSKPKSKALTNKQADKILSNFDKQPAQLTEEQVLEMAALYKDRGITVRAAFASLGRSGSQLIEAVDDREGAVALAVAANCIKDIKGSYKHLSDMLDSAELRIRLALCSREDMSEILKEAEDPKHYA